MDPNAALTRIRHMVQSHDGGAYRDSEAPANLAELVELTSALDEWLTKGGFLPDAWAPKPDAPRFYVVNNVTGERVVKGFETEDAANSMCYDMNLRAGPGGLYGVENEKGERIP